MIGAVHLNKIPRKASSLCRRLYYSGRILDSFLSGDLFASKADLSIFADENEEVSNQLVSEARVIFCTSHNLERFLDQYRGHIHSQVLLLGNSDRDFRNMNFDFPNSIQKVFAQNWMGEDPRVEVLPIGIENLRLGNNGRPSLFREDMVNREKLRKILVGPFAYTHPEREIFRSLQSSENLECLSPSERLTSRKYAEVSSRFTGIAAPRGNGKDTHRFWECLYRGSVPIVIKDSWSAKFIDLGIPLLEIDSWEELSHLDLFESRELNPILPKHVAALDWEFWRIKIKNCLS